MGGWPGKENATGRSRVGKKGSVPASAEKCFHPLGEYDIRTHSRRSPEATRRSKPRAGDQGNTARYESGLGE
jgi:hypothetical protein